MDTKTKRNGRNEKGFAVLSFQLVLYLTFSSVLLIMWVFSSNVNTPLTNEYINLWKEQINPHIDTRTLSIIINNTFVILVMWLFSVIPIWVFYSKPRKLADYKILIGFVRLVYILYFARLGVIVGVGLSTFPYKSYSFALLTTIIPHGVVEMAGLTLASSFALNWVDNFKEVKVPRNIEIVLPVILIIIAGILETTLTPYIFKTFL